MARAFSLASWNVENFKEDDTKKTRVIQFLKEQDPDVFGLYEVVGKGVFAMLVKEMTSYQFHITEGPETQEILVGVKNGFTAFFTQKVEFKSGIQTLRPGALLTLTVGGEHYPILFLHTKSSSLPLGLGIRDDQFSRAFKFKQLLDKDAGGPGKANFMFLGDLNLMGMRYPFGKDIDPPVEVDKLKEGAEAVNMRRLAKNKPYTWWGGPTGGYEPADLDQVIASEQLEFKKVEGADIEVKGWPEYESTSDQANWIKQYSDHGLLYLEVQKV